jgi:hypothetical protein
MVAASKSDSLWVTATTIVGLTLLSRMKNRFPKLRQTLIGLLLGLMTGHATLAQTALGQPSLDEAKVQIWCATLRFVFEDTGRPQLKNSLRCEGGNLTALAASIRPDSQRVYSLLYQPIEGRSAIYQGKKDNVARLEALTKAIITKLRSSAARRKDPERMARLTALETALTTYVVSGTPPGELAAPATVASADTAAVAAGPAEVAEAEPAIANTAVPAPADAAGSLMTRIFSPLALSLSLLSLVLFGLLRANVSRLLRRQQREVDTATQAAEMAQQAAAQATRATSDAAASAAAATATASQIAAGASAAAKAAAEVPAALSRLSAGQRAEVEELIRQRVAAELTRLLPPATAAAWPPPAEVPPVATSDNTAATHSEPDTAL